MSETPTLRWRPAPLRPGMPRRVHRGPWPRRVAVVVLVSVIMFALCWPLWQPYDPLAVDYTAASLPPGPGGLFGTDAAGRSLAAGVAAGLRLSLLVAAAAALLAAVAGILAGVAAGWLGGGVDVVIMRLVDGVNTIPHLLLGIVLVVFFRGSLPAMIIAIALTHWMQVARIIRSVVLPLRDAEHVQAAAVLGYRRWDLLRWHLLPAIAPQAGICLALLLPHAVWHEATLSFLGVGLQPHQASLGVLLNTGQQAIFTGAWWQLTFPAAVLVIVTVAISVTLRSRHTTTEL
ncbi:ABC transporter permease [Propionibacteriaceae bacterium Y2011]